MATKKNSIIYRLLIGLFQAKLKEASDAQEHILEMLFSANEESIELAVVLLEALALDLSPQLNLFESNLLNSNDRFSVHRNANKATYFKKLSSVFQQSESWMLWDIKKLSPLIKYRKKLCYLTISMDEKISWYRTVRKKEEGYLSHLPEEIGELSELLQLQISRMPLEELPNSIVQLSKLERLIITHTKLSTLPDGINRLSNLKVLILADNQFQSLPAELGLLKNLRVFEIQGSPLERELIPEILFDEKQSSRVVAKTLQKFFSV